MSLMSKISDLALKAGVSRFRTDERGVTAITFGLVATMLVGGIGASVEISRSITAKNALQLAVDAAVLQAKRREMDLAPKVGVTIARAQGKTAGENIFWANMAETKAYFKGNTLKVNITFNEDTAEAKAVGTGEVQQLFTGSFGVGELKLAAQAEATWSNQTPVELALVLDSTPSMFSKDGRAESRFTLLRNASKNFTNTLFNSVQDPSKELLRVSVVPWATTVNIRSEEPKSPNVDPYTSPGGITDAGSQIPLTNQIDRSSKVNIVDDFAPVGWRGCISGSNESTTVYNDDMPATKWTALATPKQAMADWSTATNLKVQTSCSAQTYYKKNQSLNGVNNVYVNANMTMTTENSGGGSCKAASVLYSQTPCVSDPNELEWNKTKGDAGWCPWKPKFAWTSNQQIMGPNVVCPHPILGLSPNRSQVMETLDRMAPSYTNTHADVGLRWALRTLSPKPEWKDFFKVKSPIAPYAKAGVDTVTKKYVVLITDGENTQNSYMPGYWGCTSGSGPGCSGTPSQTELNNRMISWCNAIKNDYKITLITIAVNVTNSTAVTLLKNCAGTKPDGTPYAYTVDANDLDRALQEIAIGVANNLRIKS